MKNAENIRKEIINTFFNNPILGKDYIDWHTEDGKCGLTIMIDGRKFDIIIQQS